MDEGLAVSLFDSEEVPESRLLLWQVVVVIVVFVESFDALEKTDGILEILGRSLDFSQLVEVSLAELEMEILRNFGAVNRGNLHDKIYDINNSINNDRPSPIKCIKIIYLDHFSRLEGFFLIELTSC